MERMKRLMVYIVIAILALSATACGAKKEAAKAEPTKPPKKQEVDAFGTVKVKDTLNIALGIPATAAKVQVKEGQRVKKGDILLTLNINDFSEQIRRKQLEIEAANIELAKIKYDKEQLQPIDIQKLANSIADVQNELAQSYKDLATKREYLQNETDQELSRLKLNLENAKSAYELAKNDYEANQSLYNSGATTKTTIDHMKTDTEDKQKNMQAAIASIDAKKYALSQEIDQLSVRINQKQTLINNYNRDKDKVQSSAYKAVELKKASVAILESDLKRLTDKLNFSYLKGNQLICDIENAVVSSIDCTDGDSLIPDKKIISLLDLGSMIVEADIAEEFIKDVKIGANSTIIPTADKSKKYTGKVIRISNKAFKKNGETNITAEISIDNKDELIRPDFNVDLKIEY